jgi:hypothetical protein
MLVTKYVITSSESNILPSDIAMKIYGSKYDVLVKETCFGVIVNGEEDVVNARRGGGARPGFYMIESESKMLPMISRALASEGEETETIPEKKKPLSIKRLDEIVKEG